MRGARYAERGFTLLEMLIASTLIVGLALAIAMGSRGVFSVWGDKVRSSQLERSASSTLDKIVADLEDADAGTIADALAPPTGSSTITFRRRIGATGGTAQLGPEITIAWSADPADPEDGVDNDGDGLIDEGRVVRTIGSASTVLVEHVMHLLDGETDSPGDENANGLEDESGLSFARVGDKLTVRLSVAHVGRDGALVAKTTVTAVQLRE